ncbi:MAG: hypothetical protein R3D59_17215 [Paracoccaceae bacterium]
MSETVDDPDKPPFEPRSPICAVRSATGIYRAVDDHAPRALRMRATG